MLTFWPPQLEAKQHIDTHRHSAHSCIPNMALSFQLKICRSMGAYVLDFLVVCQIQNIFNRELIHYSVLSAVSSCSPQVFYI